MRRIAQAYMKPRECIKRLRIAMAPAHRFFDARFVEMKQDLLISWPGCVFNLFLLHAHYPRLIPMIRPVALSEPLPAADAPTWIAPHWDTAQR
jgi:hypothetical protein